MSINRGGGGYKGAPLHVSINRGGGGGGLQGGSATCEYK